MIASVCTPLESTLGVRDTLVDLPPLRNIFEMSEFVELLQQKTKIKHFRFFSLNLWGEKCITIPSII